MEDLNAATLDDVKDWFKRYYGPNIATIVIAADDLDLVSDVLASGKNSHLYKRVVYKDQIAPDVAANVWLPETPGSLRSAPRRNRARISPSWSKPSARSCTDWSQDNVPTKNIASVEHPDQARVFLMDQP